MKLRWGPGRAYRAATPVHLDRLLPAPEAPDQAALGPDIAVDGAVGTAYVHECGRHAGTRGALVLGPGSTDSMDRAVIEDATGRLGGGPREPWDWTDRTAGKEGTARQIKPSPEKSDDS